MNSNEKNNTNETSTNKQNNLETAEILEISKKSLRSNRSFGTIIGLELAIIIAILLMKNCNGINIDFGSKETKPTTIESEIATSSDTTTSIDDTDNGNVSFPVVEQTWLISNNTKSVKLSNPALNDCDLVYEVVIDDKTIYKTENIKPNEEYNLNIYDNLEKGTYSANLNIYYVSKDGNLNKCGHQGITIVVS